MLWHTVHALLAEPRIECVFIVLAPDDTQFAALAASPFAAGASRVVTVACGGETRALSVLNGLDAMADRVDSADWVLVHDAARPCLPRETLGRLIDTLAADAVGGLLALPVADTVKRADAQGRVTATEPRESLWLAQTPQMFRHGALRAALRAAGAAVTDEAQAMELSGVRPRLVRGDARNLKVTWPGDIALAGRLMEQGEAGGDRAAP
jgi:2-C-methyl-D-erythritol 4-phosphate cytidylyltransferase